MDLDRLWQLIDQQRAAIAALVETLSPEEWETPSLCADWRVRDVAAHLTLAQMGPGTATVELARAGFRMHRMIRDTAIRQARLPVEGYPALLRGMVGSRRTAPGITPVEPLTDVLVHAQDIVLPLGRAHTPPVEAVLISADRVWSMGFPFHARRHLAGRLLVATDADWSAGEGDVLEDTALRLLLRMTGRGVEVTPRRAD